MMVASKNPFGFGADGDMVRIGAISCSTVNLFIRLITTKHLAFKVYKSYYNPHLQKI